MITEEAAYASHSRIVFMSIELWTICLRIDSHCTELTDDERLPEPSDALLPEDGRASIFVFDQYVANKK